MSSKIKRENLADFIFFDPGKDKKYLLMIRTKLLTIPTFFMKKKILLLLVLSISISFLVIQLEAGGSRSQPPVQVADENDDYDEGYDEDETNNLFWIGPGFYGGVWFENEEDFNNWQDNKYNNNRNYNPNNRNQNGNQGNHGGGGHGGGRGR